MPQQPQRAQDLDWAERERNLWCRKSQLMNRHHGPTQSKLRKKDPTRLKAFSSKGPSYNYNENASELFHESIRQNFSLMGRKQEVEKLATILILRDGQLPEPVLFHI